MDYEEPEGIHHVTSDKKLKAWGYGEWVEEPDQIEFEYLGYQCLILRMMYPVDNPVVLGMGNLNGYVKIPDDHPWNGLDEEDIPCNVHGGITYAQNRNDGFWIGFDCGHTLDIVPSMVRNSPGYMEALASFNVPISYKNISFVENEIKSIVNQCIEAFMAKHLDKK